MDGIWFYSLNQNFPDTLAQLSGLWQLEQDNEVRFVTLLKPGSINLCKCNWPADLARVRTSNKLFTKTFHEGRWWSTWLFRLNLFSWLGPEAAKMIIYKEEEFCSINPCLFNVGKCTIGQLCLLLHLSLASLQLQLKIGIFSSTAILNHNWTFCWYVFQ